MRQRGRVGAFGGSRESGELGTDAGPESRKSPLSFRKKSCRGRVDPDGSLRYQKLEHGIVLDEAGLRRSAK